MAGIHTLANLLVLLFLVCVSIHLPQTSAKELTTKDRKHLDKECSKNRALFDEHNTGNYVFEYQRVLFSTQCYTSFFDILVADNDPIRTEYALGNNYALENFCANNEELVASAIESRSTNIDELFDEIKECIQSCDYIGIEYHPTLGYPLSYFIDRNFNIADGNDDVSVYVNCLSFDYDDSAGGGGGGGDEDEEDKYACVNVHNTNTACLSGEFDCNLYFDGCNTCSCDGETVLGCTKKHCNPEEMQVPRCRDCESNTQWTSCGAQWCYPTCKSVDNLCGIRFFQAPDCDEPECRCPAEYPRWNGEECVTEKECLPTPVPLPCPEHCHVVQNGCQTCKCNGVANSDAKCPRDEGIARDCDLVAGLDCIQCANADMVFTTCGTCDQTCDGGLRLCTADCKTKCQCPQHLPILHGGECITRDECPADTTTEAPVPPPTPPPECENPAMVWDTPCVCPAFCPPLQVLCLLAEDCVGNCRCPKDRPFLRNNDCLSEKECAATVPPRIRSCPEHCLKYSDGCNDCFCDGTANSLGGCTKRGCPNGPVYESECKLCENKDMEFTTCGTCDQTCDDGPRLCTADCKTKCQCPDNKPVYHEGKCIKKSKCPQKESKDSTKRSSSSSSRKDSSKDSSEEIGSSCPLNCDVWSDGCTDCQCRDGQTWGCIHRRSRKCAGWNWRGHRRHPRTRSPFCAECSYPDMEWSSPCESQALFCPSLSLFDAETDLSLYTDCDENDGCCKCPKSRPYLNKNGDCVRVNDCCPSNQHWFDSHAPEFCDPSCDDRTPCAHIRVLPVERCACPRRLPIWDGEQCVPLRSCPTTTTTTTTTTTSPTTTTTLDIPCPDHCTRYYDGCNWHECDESGIAIPETDYRCKRLSPIQCECDTSLGFEWNACQQCQPTCESPFCEILHEDVVGVELPCRRGQCVCAPSAPIFNGEECVTRIGCGGIGGVDFCDPGRECNTHSSACNVCTCRDKGLSLCTLRPCAPPPHPDFYHPTCLTCKVKGAVWNDCGTLPSCKRTCDRQIGICPAVCYARCQCPSDKPYELDGKCVAFDKCRTPSPVPAPTAPEYCPFGCVEFFDGCNNCKCDSDTGKVLGCTEIGCTGHLPPTECFSCDPDSGMIPSECASACPATCEVPQSLCRAMCRPGCECPKEKPLLNKDGVCVAQRQCPGFSDGCPNNCIRWTPDGCNECPCDNGEIVLKDCTDHVCIRGGPPACLEYASDGECSNPEMSYNECGSACTPTCDRPHPSCTQQCVPRCECPRRKFPVLHEGHCIKAEDCPQPPNECDEELGFEWNKCASLCPATCGQPDVLCDGCSPGCQCADDKKVYHNGRCISLKQCP